MLFGRWVFSSIFDTDLEHRHIGRCFITNCAEPPPNVLIIWSVFCLIFEANNWCFGQVYCSNWTTNILNVYTKLRRRVTVSHVAKHYLLPACISCLYLTGIFARIRLSNFVRVSFLCLVCN